MEITLENYLKLKEQKLSRASIAKEFEIPEWKLKKLVAINGWGKTLPTIGNETLFDEFTELSCYWAGFLAADGNVDSKGRIRVMLKYEDIGHLEKLKLVLGSTHSIASNTSAYNRCSFEFTHRDMCEILDLNFNIVPNKTDRYKLPVCIPESLFRHYLRGYFDGDGSVCESFSNTASTTATLYATFCSGSEEFIHALYGKLSESLGLKGHLQDFGTGKKWQIKYNTNDARALLQYMYDSSTIYLDRKFNLYRQIVVNNVRMKR